MYATLADIETSIGPERLSRIADRENTGVIDAAVVDDAILRASAEIDAAVGQRYRLPFSTTPTVLRDICVELAIYIMARDPDEDQRLRVKAARDRLADLRDGRTALTDAALAGTDDEPSASGAGADLARVRPFTSGLDMRGF